MDYLENFDEIYAGTEIELAPNEIGTPTEDAMFAPGPQERVDSCAIRAQQHVLSMFGIDISETDLVNDAISHDEYAKPDHPGTALDDIGNLLERNGIDTNRYVGATMAHLISELGQGHKIIVGVDAYEIIADTPEERLIEMQRDSISETPNHAILVVNVDPHTLDVDIVDPSDGELHTVPATQFIDAWKDCNFFMVSTTQSPQEYLDEDGNSQVADANRIQTREGDITMLENGGMNYIDIDNNDIADIIETDLNQDNLVEHLALDLNQDGIPDVTIQSDPGLIRTEPSLGGLGHVSGIDSLGGPPARITPSTMVHVPEFDSLGSTPARTEPSLGGLGHASGVEPSLGGLGHASGVEPSLGGLGHASGVEPSLGGLGHASGVEPSLGGLGHVSGAEPSFGSTPARAEPSLGGLGHASGIEPSLGGLGHVSGFQMSDDYAVIGLDIDGDTVTDVYAVGMDFDGDGTFDGIGIDVNQDGIFDAIGVDINADGIPDALAIDLDGDGVIDEILNTDDFSSMV